MNHSKTSSAHRMAKTGGILVLAASGGAIAVARLIVGDSPDFQLDPIPYSGVGTGMLCAVLGVFAGLAGVAYNRALVGGLALVDRLHSWPMEWRAALIGAAVGVVAWFAPELVGGGDSLTQQALSGTVILAIRP